MSAQSAARAPASCRATPAPRPTNADAIAAAHKPYPAAAAGDPAGAVADVNLALTDRVVQIAPGVKYSAWAWAGGAPGPVIHVRQGQLVKITLTNNGAIPHSVDFHAARVAPDKAFRDVKPGESVSYTFRANDAGRLHVPLRHQAGPDAHRQRDVRRDRRRAHGRACSLTPTASTCSSPASGT